MRTGTFAKGIFTIEQPLATTVRFVTILNHCAGSLHGQQEYLYKHILHDCISTLHDVLELCDNTLFI